MRVPRQFSSWLFWLTCFITCLAPLRTLAQTTGPEVAAPSAATTAAAGSAAPLAAPLPKEWSDAIGSLAKKIKAALGDSQALTLEFQNISSLSDTDAAAIESAFRTALLGEHLELRAAADETTAKVRVTLSETAQEDVWIAQLWSAAVPSGAGAVEIVSVDKREERFQSGAGQHIALDKRLVWEQADRLLDAAAVEAPGSSASYRVVLEPKGLAFYAAENSQWTVVGERVAFTTPAKWLRSARGVIDAEGRVAWVWEGDGPTEASIRCAGDFANASSVQCAAWNQTASGQFGKPWGMRGREDRASVMLEQQCGTGLMALSTGDGDWTQTDEVQGYIVSATGGAAVASGDPMAMNGPVMELIPQGQGNAARAIVRDLATGNYEAYVVTATCSE